MHLKHCVHTRPYTHAHTHELKRTRTMHIIATHFCPRKAERQNQTMCTMTLNKVSFVVIGATSVVSIQSW